MLDAKVINRVNSADRLIRRHIPSIGGHYVGNEAYDIGNMSLQRPLNSCPSWKILVDGVDIGRIEGDIIDPIIRVAKENIKNKLIETL